MRNRLLLGSLLLAAAVPVSAQTLKPGLWEIHNKMNDPELDAAMAEMQKQLAEMPPAQRKQLEAMMAQQGVRMAPGAGAGGGMAVQMCMTREMVERDAAPMQEGCRITRQQKSGKTVRMAYQCSNPPSTGEGEWTIHNPQSYSSRMTVKSTAGGKVETTTMEATGKWLQADCGNVRPPQMPKK